VTRARRRVRERLTELGTEPTGEPSPAFTAELERKLAGGAMLAGATVLALPNRQRGGFPTASATMATIVTVLLAGALLGVIGRGGPGVFRLAVAVDTTVIMPGGHAAPARTGQDLPNGSVVWTGPNGRASAGTVEIGPGLQAVVDAGRLRLSPLAGGGGSSPLSGPVTVGAGLPAVAPAVPAHVNPPLDAKLPVGVPHVPVTPTTTRTPPTTQPHYHSGGVTTTTAPAHHRGG
jgi:hypothetical protein